MTDLVSPKPRILLAADWLSKSPRSDFGLGGLVATGLVFAVAALSFIWPGKIFIDVMLNDFFILLESLYRMAQGQLPGVHFFSNPFGIFAFAPQAAIYRFTGDLALAALWAEVLYAVLVLAFCWYISLTRLHFITGLLVTITLSVVMLAPWVLGLGDFQAGAAQTTTAMFYNRFGFILVTLAAMLSITPRREWRERTFLLDPLVAALIAAAAYYSKVPFGLAVIGLTVFWFGIVKGQASVLWKFALILLALVLLVEISWPGSNEAYIREQMWSAEVVGAVHPYIFAKYLVFLAPELLVAGLLPLAMLWFANMLTLVELVYFLLLLTGSVMLVSLSAQGFLTVTPLAVGCFGLTRCLDEPDSVRRHGWALSAIAISFAASLLMLLPPAVFTTWRHARDIRTAVPLKGLPAAYASLRVPRDVDLDLMRRAFEGTLAPDQTYRAARLHRPYSMLHALFPSEYLFTLLDLSKAVQYCEVTTPRAAIVDFADLAPSVLGIPPASGYTYMHFGRSFTDKNHLAAERLFGGVACLLDPKLSIEPLAHEAIWKIYGGYFESNFRSAGATTFWNVLVRTNGKT